MNIEKISYKQLKNWAYDYNSNPELFSLGGKRSIRVYLWCQIEKNMRNDFNNHECSGSKILWPDDHLKLMLIGWKCYSCNWNFHIGINTFRTIKSFRSKEELSKLENNINTWLINKGLNETARNTKSSQF